MNQFINHIHVINAADIDVVVPTAIALQMLLPVFLEHSITNDLLCNPMKHFKLFVPNN